MKAKLFLLFVVALTGCPTTTPPVDCATKCGSVAMPVSVCVDGRTVRDFALGLGDCSETCTFVPLDRACPGSCTQGRCVDELTPTDAGVEPDAGTSTDAGVEHDAGTIDDGGVNACMNVTCAAPPTSTCLDATRLRIFDARGVCAQGQCLYGSREELCTAGCANDACQNNPCQGITCSTPPVAVCTDAATLKSFAPMGTCNNGSCRYAETLTTCQFGCTNGRCTNDPCAGVSCGQPPAPFCSNATTLRTFSTQGVCASGSCLYTPSDTTCRFGCVNGRCTNDPCQGVTCSTPPASACVNGSTLRTFTAAGVCSGGSCLYSPVDSTCQFGCAAGSCVGNPCQGVTCSQPPAATCMNPTTLRTFSTSGTCSNGACSYASADAACPFGCANGSCTGNPCQGVTCNAPPANACLNATTLRTFNASGSCSGGACSYTSQDTTCGFGCANGACTGNPCQGVTCNQPPASTCVNPTTLRSFSPGGTCSGGSCSYTAAESTCPFGCSNGACTGNPCQGVTCGMPPASTCLTPTTLRSFSSMGTCAGGACSYTPADTTCPFGCANGSCVNDPCAGVSCTMPPARTCLTPTTLRSFAPTGTCSGGGCSYTPSDMTCGFGCANGACANDPCAGVTCTTPPATTCVGSAVRTYSTSGTCTNGTCGYTFSDTACPGGCANGACQAPTCGGATCNTPPASTCLNANRLRTAFPLGTCTNSTCGYTQYEVLCSQGCINGACIAGSWTVEFMPQASPPVLITSETIFDATGEPIQVGCEQDGSFGSGSNGTVRFRRRTLSGWLEETIDVGMGASCQARVTLDGNGEPLVAWYDSVNNDLRFARRNGGTWAPKELISTNGGNGLSIVMGSAGQPWVSYGGTTVQLGIRAADGSWTSEQVSASGATTTALRVVGSTPWILSNANLFEVATKSGSTWASSPFTSATGYSGTPFGMKADSFTVVGGVPRAMITDGNGWVWRSLISGQLYSEPIGDEPLATRTGPVPAIWVSRPLSGGGQTIMIRVRQNDAWPDSVTPVPYSTQIFRVASYSGANGRHVLIDATGRRLSSPPTCTPMCSGRTCGDDGCGGSCGTCASGFCAASGTCSPLRSQLLTGMAPSSAGIASGATSVHVLETPSTYGLAWRSLVSGVFTPASTVALGTYGLVSTRFDVLNDQPAAFTRNSNLSTALPLRRSAAGVWSTGVATPQTYYGGYRYDAAGNAYMIRCTTYQAYVSTLPAAGTAWTAETSMFTFTATGPYAGCTDVGVTPTGTIYVVYDGRLYSNAPGFTPQVVPHAARMGVDAQGNLHMVSTTGSHVWRAATNSLETDNAPPGVVITDLLVTGDRLGQTAAVFTNASGLVLARRTGTGTWSTEQLPASNVTTAPQITNGSTTNRGVAFDVSNTPHVLFNDRGAWRHVTK
ncbi:MAG: hypothetical protein Q8L14_18035 [Myxococcales bacterium]|nr:hypothetical protein [Myxococcales bacterium]